MCNPFNGDCHRQPAPLPLTPISLHSGETKDPDRVRDPNCYVRSFTQCVKDTYVGPSSKSEPRLRWPSALVAADRDNVEPQLRALPEPLGQQVLDDVAERVGTGEIKM